MNCPKCKSDKAHRSHKKGAVDFLNSLVQRIPYRCHDCKLRFYAFRAGETSPRLRSAEERRIMKIRRQMRWRKSKNEIAVYALGLVVMAGVVYLLLQQRVG